MCVDTFPAVVKMFIQFVYLLCVFVVVSRIDFLDFLLKSILHSVFFKCSSAYLILFLIHYLIDYWSVYLCVDTFPAVVKMFIQFVYLHCVFVVVSRIDFLDFLLKSILHSGFFKCSSAYLILFLIHYLIDYWSVYLCVDTFAAVVKMFIQFVYLHCVFFVLKSWEFVLVYFVNLILVQFN